MCGTRKTKTFSEKNDEVQCVHVLINIEWNQTAVIYTQMEHLAIAKIRILFLLFDILYLIGLRFKSMEIFL